MIFKLLAEMVIFVFGKLVCAIVTIILCILGFVQPFCECLLAWAVRLWITQHVRWFIDRLKPKLRQNNEQCLNRWNV